MRMESLDMKRVCCTVKGTAEAVAQAIGEILRRGEVLQLNKEESIQKRLRGLDPEILVLIVCVIIDAASRVEGFLQFVERLKRRLHKLDSRFNIDVTQQGTLREEHRERHTAVLKPLESPSRNKGKAGLRDGEAASGFEVWVAQVRSQKKLQDPGRLRSSVMPASLRGEDRA